MAKIRGERTNYYVGEKAHQLREGYGVYHYKNKFFRYEGDWAKGKKHGHGKLLMADGSYYEGDFRNGEIQGHGFRKWQHSGNSYSGEFVAGEMHGYGVLNYADGGQYKGEFFQNKRHGNGVFRDKDGNEYEGGWYNNRKHGHGVLTFWNGDVYEGDFVKGHQQGHGVLHCIDGTSFEGQWFAGTFSGEGTLNHCSGVVYEGVWTNGQPDKIARNLALVDEVKLECTQGQSFDLHLQLLDQNGEILLEENGRKFEVSAGYRHPGTNKSSQSLLELIEDIEEKPVTTPFGYDILPYPILEGNKVTGADSLSSIGSNLGNANQSKSDMKASRDSMDDIAKQSSVTDSSISIDEYRSFFEPSIPPQVVQDGKIDFKSLFLPFVPTNEAKLKKKGSRSGSAVSSSSSDSKQAMISKAKLPAEKGAKPGEYVIMVKDVTEPPFMNYNIEPFFTIVTIAQPKLAKKQSKMK